MNGPLIRRTLDTLATRLADHYRRGEITATTPDAKADLTRLIDLIDGNARPDPQARSPMGHGQDD